MEESLARLLDPAIFNVPVPTEQRKLIDEPVNSDLIDKNKYANNSEFVPDSVYRRILNQLTNYRWSFIPYKERWDDKCIIFTGLLIVPGFGIHTGIGSAKLDKKSNENALSAAKTYAFKNACKEMGLAPNVGDDQFDEMLFENEVVEYIETKKQEVEKKSSKKKAKSKKKPTSKKDTGKTKSKASLNDRIKELRDAYELKKDDHLVEFLQIWDEDVIELDDMTDEDWDTFFKYFNKNKTEFEDF
ncbi:hypothetical protein ACK8P5_26670 (plasmid) [Paenibacillus sp. EC2-1]|uniref:hypothetical protein n=1 Tax=Paenibacillus sp. EC2-1 TaxID=3388665 RepID=UPI003BEF3D5F